MSKGSGSKRVTKHIARIVVVPALNLKRIAPEYRLVEDSSHHIILVNDDGSYGEAATITPYTSAGQDITEDDVEEMAAVLAQKYGVSVVVETYFLFNVRTEKAVTEAL